MWQTNLKVLAVVLGTLAVFTIVSSSIPQLQSVVPEDLSFSGDVTAEELVAAGQTLFEGAGGCADCHGLGTRAPNLITDEAGTGQIGVRCASRVAGQDCKAYLFSSLVDPNAFQVEGYIPGRHRRGSGRSQGKVPGQGGASGRKAGPGLGGDGGIQGI